MWHHSPLYHLSSSMSGNKHDDILEHFDENKRVELKAIIQLLALFRPSLEIDRTFQRELKKKILLKQENKQVWFYRLPNISLIITSFLVLIGVWNFWGWALLREKPAAPMVWSDDAIYRKTETSELAWSPTEWISNSENTSRMMTTIAHIETDNPGEILSKNTRRENSSPVSEDIPPSDLSQSMNDEITSIVDDIDTILNEEGNPASTNTTDPLPMMATMVANDMPMARTMNEWEIITLTYPTRMAVYKKATPWAVDEIETRSASGSIKYLENTLSKTELLPTLDTSSPITSQNIVYKTAQKEGSAEWYLIPCLRYRNDTGTYYTSLVVGYRLN